GTNRQALRHHLILKAMCAAIVSVTENRSFGHCISFDRDHLDTHWPGPLTVAAPDARREVDLFVDTEIFGPCFSNEFCHRWPHARHRRQLPDTPASCGTFVQNGRLNRCSAPMAIQ